MVTDYKVEIPTMITLKFEKSTLKHSSLSLLGKTSLFNLNQINEGEAYSNFHVWLKQFIFAMQSNFKFGSIWMHNYKALESLKLRGFFN